jgi:hypothetical protein
MGCLDNDRGITLRVVYLNVLYGTMTLLGALILAALNAPVGADDEPRYLKCQLGGSTATTPARTEPECVALVADSDEEVQNQNLFNISVSVVVLSGLLFVWSLLNHGLHEKAGKATGCGTELHFRLEALFSLVQVGLFAGLVGWFNMTEFADDAAYEANLENNVFYSDYNPRTIALVGLIAGILDTVGFNVLNQFVFGNKCSLSKQ